MSNMVFEGSVTINVNVKIDFLTHFEKVGLGNKRVQCGIVKFRVQVFNAKPDKLF